MYTNSLDTPRITRKTNSVGISWIKATLCMVALTLFSCQEKKDVKVKYVVINKKIVLPQGVEINGLKQGLWIEYNDVGFINNIATYVNGIANGEGLFYNDFGRIIKKYHCKNGKLNGLFECFNDKGLLTVKGVYDDNKMKGEWFYYSDNGKLMTYELWENGKIIKKKDYK